MAVPRHHAKEQIEHNSRCGAQGRMDLPLREVFPVRHQGCKLGGNTSARALSTIGPTRRTPVTIERRRWAVLEARTNGNPMEWVGARRFVKNGPTIWRPSSSAANGGRNKRGRKIYGEVACASCHRFDNDGGSVARIDGGGGTIQRARPAGIIGRAEGTISDQYGAIVIRKKNGALSQAVANLRGRTQYCREHAGSAV